MPGDIETPGQMSGWAGIGFGLVRLALPQRVRAVLLLAGPRAASSAASLSSASDAVRLESQRRDPTAAPVVARPAAVIPFAARLRVLP